MRKGLLAVLGGGTALQIQPQSVALQPPPARLSPHSSVHFCHTTRGRFHLLTLPSPATRSTGLSDTFHVVSFDPRGYGRSRPPSRDFPVGFYQRDADDAAALMRSLGHER